MTTEIKGFEGEHRFLSNFHPALVALDGVIYDSVEIAFQAAKTTEPVIRAEFATITEPREAKKLGRRLKLRPDWEQIKDEVMLNLIRQKFSEDPRLKQQLLDTGKAYLEETNWWGDTYWGVCQDEGQNKLGHILMRVRAELQNKESNQK